MENGTDQQNMTAGGGNNGGQSAGGHALGFYVGPFKIWLDW